MERLTCKDVERRHRYERDYEVAVAEAELDLAVERVSSLDSFGTMERLPDAVEHLAHCPRSGPFGKIPWCNKEHRRTAVEGMDTSTAQSLKDPTFYDQQLYEVASNQFEDLWRQMMQELLTEQVRPCNTARLQDQKNLPSLSGAGEHLWGTAGMWKRVMAERDFIGAVPPKRARFFWDHLKVGSFS